MEKPSYVRLQCGSADGLSISVGQWDSKTVKLKYTHSTGTTSHQGAFPDAWSEYYDMYYERDLGDWVVGVDFPAELTVYISDVHTNHAKISFDWFGEILEFDASSGELYESDSFSNYAVTAPIILPPPSIQAFANIELNATPTESNHLVTVSYLTDNYLSLDSAAPSWVSGNDYALGAVVRYNDKLYKCTTEYNINIPSSLNGWAETTLTNIADSTSFGIVRPDPNTLNINNGTISLKPATTTTSGGIVVGNGLAVGNGRVSAAYGRREIAYFVSGAVDLTDDVYTYCVATEGNTTLTFNSSQLSSLTGFDIEFRLLLSQLGSTGTYTFPNNFSWLGSAPTFSSGAVTHIIDVHSYDNGTTWLGEYKGSVENSSILEISRESMVKGINTISDFAVGGGATIVLSETNTLYSADITGKDAAEFTIDSSNLTPPVVAGHTPVIAFELYLKVGNNNPTVTFPGVKWLDFEMPTYRYEGTMIITFVSFDSGTSWWGGWKGLI